jgi:hypothetical protein
LYQLLSSCLVAQVANLDGMIDQTSAQLVLVSRMGMHACSRARPFSLAAPESSLGHLESMK